MSHGLENFEIGQRHGKMKLEEPEALVLCWQILVPAVEIPEVRADCVPAYRHTELKQHLDSHQAECSGLAL